jgi:hypothetical protein
VSALICQPSAVRASAAKHILIGMLAIASSVNAATHYVDVNSTNATSPFLDWSTAATSIQDAIDVGLTGEEILVADGVYRTGGRLVGGTSTTNRVAVTQPLIVQSVNGPGMAVIEGYSVPGTTNGVTAVRCVYLTNGAFLSGFTLTNGATVSSDYGGGVFMQTVPNHTTSVVSNCVVVHNSAHNSGGGISGGGTVVNCRLLNNWGRQNGGGAYGSVLVGCILKGNTSWTGGGSEGSVLTNCLLVGNSSTVTGGGGSYGDKLFNCTVVSNSATGVAPSGGGGVDNATIVVNSIVCFNNAMSNPNYFDSPMVCCCTTPLASGSGNITNAPQFFDPATDNYRLQSTSPCIGAGTNSYAQTTTDLDGNPRISGTTVDIGAYEFVYTSSVLPYAWAQQYGLPTDGSADFADTDGDGMNNWQEWIAGTNPTNPFSLLKLTSVTNAPAGFGLIWQSVPNRTYYVQRATNLLLPPSFSTLYSNIEGVSGTTSVVDTNPPLGAFYRVGVQ